MNDILQKEAEEYAKKQYVSDKEDINYCIQDYIAGATSKYVYRDKIQAQIDVLRKITDVSHNDSDALYNCDLYISELTNQLNSL